MSADTLAVRKNKETPQDFYANDAVWNAVYKKAVPELKDAMDLAYLTGQRPADVLVMRRDDIEAVIWLCSSARHARSCASCSRWTA